MREPGLDVLAGGAGVVAGREEVEIDRPLRAHVAGRPLGAEVRRTGQIGGLTAQVDGLFSHRERPPPLALLSRFRGDLASPRTLAAPLSVRRAGDAPHAYARAKSLSASTDQSHAQMNTSVKTIGCRTVHAHCLAFVGLCVTTICGSERDSETIKRAIIPPISGAKQGRLRRELPCGRPAGAPAARMISG